MGSGMSIEKDGLEGRPAVQGNRGFCLGLVGPLQDVQGSPLVLSDDMFQFGTIPVIYEML